MTDKLGPFGYIHLTARGDNLLCKAGGKLPAHEFHYAASSDPGCGFTACKPTSDRAYDCVHTGTNLYAGFPHLHLWSCPDAAARFVAACRRWGEVAHG